MAHHKSLGEEGRKDGEGTGATRSPVPGGVSPIKRAAPVPAGVRGQSRTPCPLLRPTAGCCTHGVFSQRGFVPVGFFPSGVFSLCDFLPPASAPGLLLPRGHPEEQLGIRKTPSKGSRMGLHGPRAEEYLGAEVQSRQGGSLGSNEPGWRLPTHVGHAGKRSRHSAMPGVPTGPGGTWGVRAGSEAPSSPPASPSSSSPLADLRLQLLDVKNNPYLIKALYGLLMLLPQSSAFQLLSHRLQCVPNPELMQSA